MIKKYSKNISEKKLIQIYEIGEYSLHAHEWKKEKK